ncbi:helix-turn-helix domain-containing protein [Companilactobacillus jidongensis]|uniref:helix-turn-helix domain-containing protein n=1 Tax=Companilactobacillus jidongensis TaxID=2486006 RepID=UPI000F783941|nr:helix-turn-helix transcriptional regulator [Companilactobacillus jidongensis]
MFLGSVIYDKRRSMHLTQTELAADVCTQNTISKIEKHNISPTVNILTKLCLKLELSLNDVFSDFSSNSTSEEESILDALEKDLLLDNTDDISEKLSMLHSKLSDVDLKQVNLIKGALEYNNADYDNSLFTLDKVLQLTKSDVYDIYTLLTYLYKGMNYMKQGHKDRAQYYFEMIESATKENLQIANANEIELIYICKSLAGAYIELKIFDKAWEYCIKGIELAKGKHTTYFVDSLNYYASESIENDESKSQEYRELRDAAYYFAKFTNDTKLLDKMV